MQELHIRDTLDTTSSSKSSDGGLGNTPADDTVSRGKRTRNESNLLDVVTKDLPVSLGTALTETLATFSSTRHDV